MQKVGYKGPGPRADHVQTGESLPWTPLRADAWPPAHVPDGAQGHFIVCCSMHGEHNTRAQTCYATIGQNLYNDVMVAAVNTVLHEKWKMNHHKAKKIDPKQGLTKESALHFNGPEGIVVDARRGEVLDISAKNNRVMVDALWEAQDYMFSIWRTVEYDPTKWKALADKARAAAKDYRDIFMAMTGGNDGTITMHYAMYHWPEHIEEHGSLCHTNA